MAAPESIVNQIRPSEGIARQVQDRLATILLDVCDKDKHEDVDRIKEKKQRSKFNVESVVQRSEHNAKQSGDRWHCDRCNTSSSGSRGPLLRWLQMPCVPGFRGHGDRRVQLGRQPAHPSHRLQFDDTTSVWICMRCGYFGHKDFKLLLRECSGHTSRAGRQNLERVRKGLRPGSSAEAVLFNQGRRMSHR